jgi:RNA polymerase sigma-70 factor (ECF subfamily)
MLSIPSARRFHPTPGERQQIRPPLANWPPIAAGPHPSDQTLIEAIAGGDRRAMELLYARHKARVDRYVRRMIGDAILAEDVVSDVFLEVWRGADSFKAKSRVATWLLAIARHRALSACRRRVEYRLDECAAIMIADPADNPETEIQRKDRNKLIQACMSQLSKTHREVVELVYYRQKSIEEVARIIAVPVGTVKTRMFYARNRMGKLLAEVGVDGRVLH